MMKVIYSCVALSSILKRTFEYQHHDMLTTQIYIKYMKYDAPKCMLTYISNE